MSHRANLYLKEQLVVAPNGEPVTLVERAILWYLADSHNDESSAAWPSVETMAHNNGISPRRVREILQSCIRKRIIWRDLRFDKKGRQTSNYWRFTVIDGEPPVDSQVVEEQLQIVGRAKADKTNALKNSKKVFGPELVTDSASPHSFSSEISHSDNAEVRMGACESSHGEDAEVRMGVCESSHGEDAEVRIGGMRKLAALELELNTTEALENRSGSCSESPNEPAATNGGGKFSNVWKQLLSAMVVTRALPEKYYLAVAADTRQSRAWVEADGLHVEITVRREGLEDVLRKYEQKIAATAQGRGLGCVVLEFKTEGQQVTA